MQSMALFSRLESNRASITGNLHFVNISSVFISQSGVKNPSGWHRDYCSCYLGMPKKKKKKKIWKKWFDKVYCYRKLCYSTLGLYMR